MFIQSFPYRFINKHPIEINGRALICHNYSFVGKLSKKRYIVVVEEYDYNVFAAKFYLAEHKSCVHKYSRLSKLNECTRVLTTVGQIIVEIFTKNPLASFVFIGSSNLTEAEENTKRSRLYARVMKSVISPVYFEHKVIPKISAYLLLNRKVEDADFANKVYRMFTHYYPQLNSQTPTLLSPGQTNY